MRKSIHNLVLAALFFALGLILPFFTGQIPQIGSMLLPMHIPGAHLRSDLRLAVWRAHRLYPAAAALCPLRYAADLPDRHCNGV